ncbi:hypothetical protein [Chitinophaga sp.]|uniref:DUF6934 family protein n=1 Tax=Chitinophaga sp. TaxID=1869181 RepID=UPI0031D362E1
MAFEKIYPVREAAQEQSLMYLFVSNGTANIVKAIEYQYMQDIGFSPLFNLGFGDYDVKTDTISDQCVSNNGDHYTVFHTILSTIPRFFEMQPHALIVVQGSDSGQKFADCCKVTCLKGCKEVCRKINRRINAYRWYVEKNFEQLNNAYTFYGGAMYENGNATLEDYCKGKEYKAVFCMKKGIPLGYEN